jgi:putative transposase
MVTLIEQHVIKATDPRFDEIDAAAFAAKNLYNLGNYTIRQSWLGTAASLMPNSTTC